METQKIVVRIATTADGMKSRTVLLNVCHGDTGSQANVLKNVALLAVSNHGVWFVKLGAATKAQWAWNQPLELFVRINSPSFTRDYEIGDHHSVLVAHALHLLGYLTKTELVVHRRAHRDLHSKQYFENQKADQLEELAGLVAVLGKQEVREFLNNSK